MRNLDGRMILLGGLLVILLAALWVSVSILIDIAGTLDTRGTGDFAQGMVLTAITGVIASLLASVTLLVKSLADTKPQSGRRSARRSKSETDDVLIQPVHGAPLQLRPL